MGRHRRGFPAAARRHWRRLVPGAEQPHRQWRRRPCQRPGRPGRDHRPHRAAAGEGAVRPPATRQEATRPHLRAHRHPHRVDGAGRFEHGLRRRADLAEGPPGRRRRQSARRDLRRRQGRADHAARRARRHRQPARRPAQQLPVQPAHAVRLFRYPLEIERIGIGISPVERGRSQALVPDLDSYDILLASQKPGLEPDLHLRGWTIEVDFLRAAAAQRRAASSDSRAAWTWRASPTWCTRSA
ncbi:MAG: hypothetical protein MZW92_34665 [Comamonadaceae bacterium]|nr:hypothetical protein [Comamonadaceae bacterium]